eukprot:3050922-Lingulodinium_polyedra.AAC.1
MRSNRPSASQIARFAHSMRTPKNGVRMECGVREACDLRAVAAADGRLDRAIAHGFQICAQ